MDIVTHASTNLPIKQHLMAKAKALGFATDQLLFIRQANQVEYESGRHVVPEHH